MHTRTVRSCEWAPGGRLLATASFDATTGIWESLGGQFECVATLEVSVGRPVVLVVLEHPSCQ